MTVTVTSKQRPSLKCSGCMSTLEFDLGDLQFMRVDGDYIDPGTPAAGIKCPECSTVTEWRKAPAAVIDRLQNAAEARK